MKRCVSTCGNELSACFSCEDLRLISLTSKTWPIKLDSLHPIGVTDPGSGHLLSHGIFSRLSDVFLLWLIYSCQLSTAEAMPLLRQSWCLLCSVTLSVCLWPWHTWFSPSCRFLTASFLGLWPVMSLLHSLSFNSARSLPLGPPCRTFLFPLVFLQQSQTGCTPTASSATSGCQTYGGAFATKPAHFRGNVPTMQNR